MKKLVIIVIHLALAVCFLFFSETSKADEAGEPHAFFYLAVEKDDVVFKGDSLTEVLQGLYKQFGVDLVCDTKKLVRISVDAKAKEAKKDIRARLSKGYTFKGKFTLWKALIFALDMHGLACVHSLNGITAYLPEEDEAMGEFIEVRIIRSANLDECFNIAPLLPNEKYLAAIHDAISRYSKNTGEFISVRSFDSATSTITINASSISLTWLNAKLCEKMSKKVEGERKNK